MGRHLDKLLEEAAAEGPASRRRRQQRSFEEPEGLVRPAQRPAGTLDVNPLRDPLARIKRPLRAMNGPAAGTPHVEFEASQIVEIRYKFHATQRHFARMFGISVETLRNWEQGKRRPHGPSRALLRVAKANPEAVARTLWRFRRAWWMD
jgi:putative transcriptional regulator